MERFPTSSELESQPYSDEVAAYAAQALKRSFSRNKSDADLQDTYEDFVEDRIEDEYEVVKAPHLISESEYLPVARFVSDSRFVEQTRDVIQKYEKIDSMLERIHFISEQSIPDQIQILNSDLFTDNQRQVYEEQLKKSLAAIRENDKKGSLEPEEKSIKRDSIEHSIKEASIGAVMIGTKYQKMCEKAEAMYQANNPGDKGDVLSILLEENQSGQIVHNGAESDVSHLIEAYDFIETMTRQKHPGLSGDDLEEKVTEVGSKALNDAYNQRKYLHDVYSPYNYQYYKLSSRSHLITGLILSESHQKFVLDRVRIIKPKIENVSFERVIELGERCFRKALDLTCSVPPYMDTYDTDEHGDESYASYSFPWLSKMPADIIEKCHRLKKHMPKDERGDEINDLAEDLLTEPLLDEPASLRKRSKLVCHHAEKIGVLCDFCDQGYRFNDLDALDRAVKMVSGAIVTPHSRAFIEEAANFVPPEEARSLPGMEALHLTANRLAGSIDESEMLDALHQIQTLYYTPEAGWLLQGDISENLSFPIGQRNSAKYSWCSRHSLVNLGPDWGEQTIGKFIYTRLQNGIEPNLHDASMLLSTFSLPKETYDIAAIKRDRADGTLKDFENYRIQLADTNLEESFLGMLFSVSGDQKNKIRLPTTDQKIYQLFSDPSSMFLYKEVLKYWDAAKDKDELRLMVLTNLGADLEKFKKDYIRSGKVDDSGLLLKENFVDNNFFEGLADIDYQAIGPRDISIAMSSLAKLGQARREYVDDATRFLTRHMVAPSDSMRKVWPIRAMALADGVDDNVSSIENWAKVNDTKAYYHRMQDYYEDIGLSLDDVDNNQAFIDELSRDYDPDTVLDELAAYKNWERPDKIVSPDERRLKYKDGKEYIGTILGKDDPRGMTIGVDTGCCMTIDGASESCIESGYKDKDAGFFALYEGSGKIMAQSYFYTNQEENPEVLVMDNIESNAGRGADKIIDLYREYFRGYLLDRFHNNPDWQIREVHIGTGYGDLVKPIVMRLDSTDIVLNSHDVYTDASGDQHLLLRLTDDEIVRARENNREISPPPANFTPTHVTSERTSSLGVDQAEAVAYLESELYPEAMRQYDDVDFLYSELTQPGVSEYSFFINSETDATKRPVGYCLAYEAESETDPSFKGKNLYIADFGITEGNRSFSAALNGLDEILSRANQRDVDQIEMAARESTSYRLLTSDFGKRLLARRGYSVEDFGVEDVFGEDESTHLLRLTKIA